MNARDVAELFEAIMIVCFGLSWPMNIVKALRARTAKGTSVLFMIFIWIGYLTGIVSKIIKMCLHTFSFDSWIAWLGFAFYIVNILMVSAGIALYFKNKQLDKLNAGKSSKK